VLNIKPPGLDWTSLTQLVGHIIPTTTNELITQLSQNMDVLIDNNNKLREAMLVRESMLDNMRKHKYQNPSERESVPPEVLSMFVK